MFDERVPLDNFTLSMRHKQVDFLSRFKICMKGINWPKETNGKTCAQHVISVKVGDPWSYPLVDFYFTFFSWTEVCLKISKFLRPKQVFYHKAFLSGDFRKYLSFEIYIHRQRYGFATLPDQFNQRRVPAPTTQSMYCWVVQTTSAGFAGVMQPLLFYNKFCPTIVDSLQ